MFDAVFNASKRRMRPIFLTSAAATMGVLPMVMGDSALWKPMGVVIFWGTPITMIFILTVIPVAYCLMKNRKKEMRANHLTNRSKPICWFFTNNKFQSRMNNLKLTVLVISLSVMVGVRAAETGRY